MGKTTSRTTSRVCLQTKSSHTVIGQFCIRIICRSCTINVVRSPSTGPFGVNLNCLRINTEILKCPIPLWTDLEGPGFAVLVSWAVRPNPASGLARSRTIDHHAVEQRTTGRADQLVESHQTPDVRAGGICFTQSARTTIRKGRINYLHRKCER